MKPYLLISLLCLVHSLSAQITDISEGEIFDGEPFMVVNSTNTQHIVIMWMGFNGLDLVTIKLKISEDCGTSWSDEIVLPHTNPGYTAADPSMGYDSDGNLFICYIDYNPLGTAGKVITRKSADGGYTWSDPVPVIDVAADGSETPVDRPWMVIDRSATASDGNIYVTTKPAPWIPFPNRNYFIASTDYGASFGDWRYIDTIGWQLVTLSLHRWRVLQWELTARFIVSTLPGSLLKTCYRDLFWLKAQMPATILPIAKCLSRMGMIPMWTLLQRWLICLKPIRLMLISWFLPMS